MRLGIVGSRNFTDWDCFQTKINQLPITWNYVSLIVSGGAEGADSMGELFADRHGIKTKIIKPDWRQYGKKAGFIRNGEIVKESDILLCFWDGISRGTADTINKAKVFKKTTLIVYV